MELGCTFNDKHEYLSFKTPKERESYWVGRLVKSKLDIKVDLFQRIAADTIGMVLSVSSLDDGLAYLLQVRWMTGDICQCYQHDVFAYDAHADDHTMRPFIKKERMRKEKKDFKKNKNNH